MEIKDEQAERLRFQRASKRVKAIVGFYKHLAVYIIINAFLLALKYFNMEEDETFYVFGTFSTSFFWGIGLAFHAVSVFGPTIFLGPDWEERKIKEIMDRDKHNKWE